MSNRAYVSATVRVVLFAALLVFLATMDISSSPQQSSNVVESSYLRARTVLDASKKALAGTGDLPGMDDLSFKISGTLYARQQSPSADRTDALPLTGQLTHNVKNSWIAWDVQTEFPGGFKVNQGARLKGDQSNGVNHTLKAVTPLPNAANSRELLSIRVPYLLLDMASQRANTLRWIGEADFQGRRYNVVTFATANGTQYALYFDARTNLLSKYETLISDPYLGDAVNEFTIKGWQTVAGKQFPTGQTLTTGGELGQDYNYTDVRINAKPADSTFETPVGYTAQTPPTVPLGVKELAKDVWMVEGLGGGFYASLFVAFNDHILVLDPPVNDQTAKTLIQKIKETVPAKPIRYVAVTHHHSDHAGGIRTFIAEGATIVTTPGNVPYFEKTAARRFTMPPDALQLNPRKPAFEVIRDHKRVFSDGTHVVELIDIGPNPHANEMVVAWLPKERILYEGDLFVRNPDNSVAPAIAATVHFADAVRKLGLQPATWVDVHSRTYTSQDLQAALDLGKQGAVKASN